jgi:hypothetical protein
MKNQHVNENYAIAINRLQKLKDGFWFSPINKFAVFGNLMSIKNIAEFNLEMSP